MAKLIHGIAAVPSYSEAAILPDGRLVAGFNQTRTRANPWHSDRRFTWHPMDHPADPMRVTATPLQSHPNAGSAHERAIAWSRDGRLLAFLSDGRTSGQQQLYVMTVADRAVRALTNVHALSARPNGRRTVGMPRKSKSQEIRESKCGIISLDRLT
jgi:hypothetical protein